MSTLLLDSSVWLAAMRAAAEPAHVAATAILRRRSKREVELRLLDLTPYELGNVAICKWHFDAAAAQRVIARALDLTGTPPLVPTAEERRAALELAQRDGLSVYDATYGAVAKARRITLVSEDRQLLAAGLAVTPADV